jgi:hypothetical protein
MTVLPDVLFRDLGLIVNPCAGRGVDVRAVESLLDALGTRHVVSGPGPLGAGLVDPKRWALDVVPVPNESGAGQTFSLARGIAAHGVPAVAVIGGDGTLADVAGAIVGLPNAPILCGIASGSMNVGQLVTCLLADVCSLDPRRLEVRPVPAFVVTMEKGRALAFNDVVFGTTLVGTVDGRLRDLDAMAYLQGQVRQGRPRRIGQVGTRVVRTGTPGYGPVDAAGNMVIASGRRIGGVVAGFTSQAYVGKAVTGGICLSSLVGLPAGCLVADVPLARVGLSVASVAGMRPVRSSFASLTDNHTLVVAGVRAGTILLTDGNPFGVLRPDDRVEITVRTNALRALQSPKHSVEPTVRWSTVAGET